MLRLETEVPVVFAPLDQAKRYKGAYGGRGGAKSHYYAQKLLLRAYAAPTRAVCIREVQNSLKESVKQLLEDKIAALGLAEHFRVLDYEIRGKNGSLIIFKGMSSYNAQNIKSLENYDIAWVEEAQTLSEASLKLLRPTIRRKGSELWFSWNPRFKTDPVDIFFRKSPPENAVSVAVGWQDNPWFRDTELYADMLADYARDEDEAEHVWGGAYGSSKGSILGKWVSRARRADRIRNDVTYDPQGAPIEVTSDIGFHDTASWWFWQRKVGGFSLIGYRGASGFDAGDWCVELDEYLAHLGVPQRKLGRIWLPHDARAKTFQSRHSSVERFIVHYGAAKIGVIPVARKADQISAARLIIDSCDFNAIECESGIDGLEAWEFTYNEETNEFSREPLHNFASHPADAFAGGAQIMRGLAPPSRTAGERHLEVSLDGRVPEGQITLVDAWRTQRKASHRI